MLELPDQLERESLQRSRLSRRPGAGIALGPRHRASSEHGSSAGGLHTRTAPDIAALRREYSVPVRLLGIGLPLTILAGLVFAAILFGLLSFGEALLLAIILAPTDAALGQVVVTEPRLPSRIRQGLNVESGLNDGICVPLLFIALPIADAEAHSETTHGAIVLVVEAIGYGVLFGVFAGAPGALLLRLASAHELIEPSWMRVVPVGTAALSYGLAAPLGGS